MGYDSAEVRAAAAGAILNCSATASCAEAVRDATIEVEERSSKAVTPKAVTLTGFELLLRLLGAEQPLLRARGAGALFNCSAFGPDNRLEMKAAGVLKQVVAALKDPKSNLGAPRRAEEAISYRIQACLR